MMLKLYHVKLGGVKEVSGRRWPLSLGRYFIPAFIWQNVAKQNKSWSTWI